MREWLRAARALVVVVAGIVGTSCAPSVKPVGSPDPQAACPAGRTEWKLEIADQRAERRDSERVTTLLRDSLTRSFPGCHWTSGGGADTIRLEIHRFGVRFDETWNAAADWTVLVADRGGRTLTEFEASAEVARPNYRGANNEREALQEAFEQALRRTLAGLRAVSSPG